MFDRSVKIILACWSQRCFGFRGLAWFWRPESLKVLIISWASWLPLPRCMLRSLNRMYLLYLAQSRVHPRHRPRSAIIQVFSAACMRNRLRIPHYLARWVLKVVIKGFVKFLLWFSPLACRWFERQPWLRMLKLLAQIWVVPCGHLELLRRIQSFFFWLVVVDPVLTGRFEPLHECRRLQTFALFLDLF